MSLARRIQDRILAQKAASAPVSGSGHTRTAAVASPTAAPSLAVAPAPIRPVNTAAALIATRMRHDKQRLKQLKSADRKVAAKLVMLPEYAAWCQGLLDAGAAADGRALPPTGADDVLPTVMIWRIDVGDYAGALDLARYMLRHDIVMPAHFRRDAPTAVLEMIAEAAIKAQALDQDFPLDVLEAVEELTADVDMHDEPRAKLMKALGAELARCAGMSTGDAILPSINRAVDVLTRAQTLNDRVGVKTILRGLERTRAAATKLSAGDTTLPTGVGGSEARPAETSTQPPAGDMCSAKAGNDATTNPQE